MTSIPKVDRVLHGTTLSSERAFLGVSALVFAAGLAATIACSASMSAMGEMAMPGGWTMSMAWMRMPGQTWPNAAMSFLAMWYRVTED